MISCDKATELISKKMDEPLSSWEKVQLFAHTLLCWCCKLFEKQALAIRDALQEMANEEMAFQRFDELNLPGLSEEAKHRIIKRIRNSS